jgi:hypothetical protein
VRIFPVIWYYKAKKKGKASFAGRLKYIPAFFPIPKDNGVFIVIVGRGKKPLSIRAKSHRINAVIMPFKDP